MIEPWWQVQAAVPADLAEAVAWLLADRLGIAVEVQDAGTLIQGDAPESARVVIGRDGDDGPGNACDGRSVVDVRAPGQQAANGHRQEEHSWTRTRLATGHRAGTRAQG